MQRKVGTNYCMESQSLPHSLPQITGSQLDKTEILRNLQSPNNEFKFGRTKKKLEAIIDNLKHVEPESEPPYQFSNKNLGTKHSQEDEVNKSNFQNIMNTTMQHPQSSVLI